MIVRCGAPGCRIQLTEAEQNGPDVEVPKYAPVKVVRTDRVRFMDGVHKVRNEYTSFRRIGWKRVKFCAACTKETRAVEGRTIYTKQ